MDECGKKRKGFKSGERQEHAESAENREAITERENLIAHGLRTKLFERDAKKIERIRNYNPFHKSELRKYQDSSGAKAPFPRRFRHG